MERFVDFSIIIMDESLISKILLIG